MERADADKQQDQQNNPDARLLGYDDAADLLQETLDEEGEADKTLTNLAETTINVEAEEADDGDEAPTPAPRVRKRKPAARPR